MQSSNRKKIIIEEQHRMFSRNGKEKHRPEESIIHV
jgi:hypothetical protein